MDTAYISYIRQLATDNKNVVFFNSGPEHASFVMSTLFNKAKESVKIFAGNLNGPVSKSKHYLEELEDFLNRNGKLHILLQEYDPKIGFNLKDLLSYQLLSGNDNIKIKISNSSLIDNRSKRKAHFTVADDSMYRLETDIEKYLAEGNFKDEKSAKILSKKFDEIFEDESSIQIELI